MGLGFEEIERVAALVVPDTARAGHPRAAEQILARQDRIPVWALPYRYLLIIGIGYFFTFFDIADIGYGMPAIEAQFHLTGSQGLFVALAVGLVGYGVGSIVIGTIADRVGRYKVLLLTIGLTALGSFLDATAGGIITLSLWRFITGMGVGADLNLVSTYVGELSPAAQRGRISNVTFLVGILGQAITPFVALALVPELAYGWRLLFVVGGLIATVGLIARVELPESPRWLAHHGHLVEADRLVRRMEAIAEARGVILADPRLHDVSPEGHRFPLQSLARRPYATRVLILVAMWFFWYIGNYGFLGDAATLIADHGFPVGSSILYLGIGAIGYPVGAAIMAWLADHIDRRVLILSSTVSWLISMLIVGALAGVVTLTFGLFLASVSLGLFLQVAYTYTAELFPTRARATGFALSDGLGHTGGAVGALLLPGMVAASSFFIGFACIGITGLIAGLIALLGPATSGRRLEQVSR